MSLFLLIDFGASRVKHAVFDSVSGKFIDGSSCPSAVPSSASGGLYEVDPRAHLSVFRSICDAAVARHPGIEGIYFCSEMHGFVLLDSSFSPLTPYISWKDERSLKNVATGGAPFNIISRAFGGDYKKTTGMKLRPGFAFPNFVYAALNGTFPDKCYIASLPDWLCSQCPGFTGKSHITMSAGLGFLDIRKNEPSGVITGFCGEIIGITPDFFTSSREVCPAACYRHAGREVPVYTGVGDHQCAILGAGNSAGTVSVNAGTGSQVSVMGDYPGLSEYETRPYFGGGFINTVTHIPSGRALETYLGLFGADTAGVWEKLALLSDRDVLDSSLKIDLAVFPGAYGYKNGGFIGNISEGGFSADEYLASLARCLSENYSELVKIFSAASGAGRTVLSGGIPRRIPALKSVIEKQSGLPASMSPCGEETLAGLAALALSDGKGIPAVPEVGTFTLI